MWEAGNGLSGCCKARGSSKLHVDIKVESLPLCLGSKAGFGFIGEKKNGQGWKYQGHKIH
jgi:hypothetical protein